MECQKGYMNVAYVSWTLLPRKEFTKKNFPEKAEKTVAFATGTPMHLYAQDFDEREDFDNQLALHPSLSAVSWMDWGWEGSEVGNRVQLKLGARYLKWMGKISMFRDWIQVVFIPRIIDPPMKEAMNTV